MTSMLCLSDEDRVAIHAFVIMPNHIHLLWSDLEHYKMEDSENSLLKFTAQSFKKYLFLHNDKTLFNYLSTQSDRKFHFWERRSRTIEVKSRKIAEQKLTYIHNNPIQQHWKLVDFAEDYVYSSASFYIKGDTRYTFLKHNVDYI